MTKNELRQLYHINREILDIKDRIAELQGDYIKATRMSHDNARPSGTSDKVGELACRIADLHTLYTVKLQELYLKKAQIERFIDTIEDAETRLILRLRHINCLTWEQIGYEIHCDGSWARRKYNKLASVLIRQENQKQM